VRKEQNFSTRRNVIFPMIKTLDPSIGDAMRLDPACHGRWPIFRENPARTVPTKGEAMSSRRILFPNTTRRAMENPQAVEYHH
jgi:hypothetical protein